MTITDEKIEVLEKAIKLLEPRGAWLQGQLEKKKGDRKCYCAYGALRGEVPTLQVDSVYFDLSNTLRDNGYGCRDLIVYNDHIAKDKRYILRLFRAQIRKYKKEQA